MKQEFWHNAWNSGKTGWQQRKVNTRLQDNWVHLDPTARLPSANANTLEVPAVLVPLCGSSLDLLWLVERGVHVVGCELSEVAVRTFFSDAGIEPVVEEKGDYLIFSADRITICCGDYFALDSDALSLPPLVAAYDRAALVAMPPAMRQNYVDKTRQLLEPGASIMLISFGYDQSKMDGPPFSVPEREVAQLYGNGFELRQVAINEGPEILGNLAQRGLDTLTEIVYIAKKR